MEKRATEKNGNRKNGQRKIGHLENSATKWAGRKKGQHKVIVRKERQRYFRLQKKWQPQTYHRLVSTHVL